jgi:hypothetical protein
LSSSYISVPDILGVIEILARDDLMNRACLMNVIVNWLEIGDCP